MLLACPPNALAMCPDPLRASPQDQPPVLIRRH